MSPERILKQRQFLSVMEHRAMLNCSNFLSLSIVFKLHKLLDKGHNVRPTGTGYLLVGLYIADNDAAERWNLLVRWFFQDKPDDERNDRGRRFHRFTLFYCEVTEDPT
jgi:hypothetical protein